MTDVAPTAAAGLVYLRALYPQGPPPSLRVLRMDRGEGEDWRQVVGESGECHLIWEACAGLGARFDRFLRIARLRRQVPCRLFGVHGAVERPEVVVSLSRGVLDYAHTVTFRYADSPLRILLKRFAGLLPGSLLWPGPVVALIPPRGDGDESLVLFSADRLVAFLFRQGKARPYAVRKSGEAAALAAEAENHHRARQLLGTMVPDLWPGSADTSSLTLEYIPEHTLLNAVASAWFGRRRGFERQAIGHLTVCLEVYRRFIRGAPPVVEPVTAAEVDDLLAGLEALPGTESERERLGAALRECVGAMLPRLIQHGDFCVRNVLIAGGERGRVLIDWEDLREGRLPLADFTLLRLSLKEAFAGLFRCSLDGMEQVPELAQGLAAAERELADLLGLNGHRFRQAALLSLACLCGQNLSKKRYPTARAIFDELLRVCRA